jgi:Cadherin domain/FG-GAP repeat
MVELQVSDLAIRASGCGAVHVVFLNSDGTAKNSRKIANDTGGGPTLRNYDNFGSAVAALGDLDGDGVTELAVGAERDDTGGNSRGAAYVLFLNRANASPIFTSPAMATVAENTTAVVTVTATDIDAPPQTVTFSIVGGADQAKFSISSGGVLSFISPPDFETPTDADGDNVYVLMVQANDGNGGTATQTISVTVTPVNDNSPVFTSADAVNVAENTTAVMTVTATDADIPSQPLTFSLAGGADQSKFSITSTGMLSFLAPPDFEQPTDANGDNLYVVIVQASDGSLTDLQAILVTVTNVNDLTGDYNRNGTVDAADYVVWRKTLSTNVPNGTGADGDGDGVVDAGDHGVWRENFGRTQGEEAAAAIAQGSIAAAAATVDEAAPPLARSDEGRMPALSPAPAAAVTHSISSRGSSFRAALRSGFEAAATRDDALLAWETARLAVVEQSPETHATLFGTKTARSQLTDVHKLADSDLSCKHFAAFDCAIESLGL